MPAPVRDCIGNIFGSFVAASVRNPAAAPKVFGNVLLGFALTEAIALFALVGATGLAEELIFRGILQRCADDLAVLQFGDAEGLPRRRRRRQDPLRQGFRALAGDDDLEHRRLRLRRRRRLRRGPGHVPGGFHPRPPGARPVEEIEDRGTGDDRHGAALQSQRVQAHGTQRCADSG